MADTGPRGPQGPAGTSIDLPVAVANGGTGATTASQALANLGIANGINEVKRLIVGATYSVGDTIQFFENPANFDMFTGRVNYMGANTAFLAGSEGSRAIIMTGISITDDATTITTAEVAEQAAGDNYWKLARVNAVTFSASGVAFNNLNETQLNIQGMR